MKKSELNQFDDPTQAAAGENDSHTHLHAGTIRSSIPRGQMMVIMWPDQFGWQTANDMKPQSKLPLCEGRSAVSVHIPKLPSLPSMEGSNFLYLCKTQCEQKRSFSFHSMIFCENNGSKINEDGFSRRERGRDFIFFMLNMPL